jgi:hypothetical protein
MFGEGNFLFEALVLFVQLRILNLRNLANLRDRNVSYHNQNFDFGIRNSEIKIYTIPVLMHLKFLNELLGDYFHLKKAFELAATSSEVFRNYQEFTPSLIYLLSINQHQFFRKGAFHFSYEGQNLLVKAEDKFSSEIKEVTLHDFEASEKGAKATNENIASPSTEVFWKACLKCIKVLHAKGFLN